MYHQIAVLVSGSQIEIKRSSDNLTPDIVTYCERFCLKHYGSQAYYTNTATDSGWYAYNLPAPSGHGFYAEWEGIDFNQVPKEVRLMLLIGA